MNITGVVLATVVVSVIGILVGLMLGFVGAKFKVKVNEKEVAVRELLPGNNCGACGYAGCDGLAAAIANGTAPVNACPVGGSSVANAISEVMGVETQEKEKQVAFVKCTGPCEKTKIQYHYYGIADCKKAAVVPGGGEKACNYGCMGYGSCVKVCEFDAIHIVDGVAVVDKEKCVACGKCISTCPNHLIELIPYQEQYMVGCNINDKGKAVKEVCEAGCIGCMLCTKVCETGAITVKDNLAHIDTSKCTNCGKCAEKCPVKVIQKR